MANKKSSIRKDFKRDNINIIVKSKNRVSKCRNENL